MSIFTHFYSDVFSQVGEKGEELHQESQEFIHSTNIYWASTLPGMGNTLRQGRHIPCPYELLSYSCHSPLVNSHY